MSGWVTVTGPPRAICSRKRGITLPALPKTLPNRTTTNAVPPPCSVWHTISASRFDAPITDVGLTALSVETSTNFSTFAATDARAITQVPYALLRTACQAFVSSISGTCLYAAAWKTTFGFSRSSTSSTSAACFASPTTVTIGSCVNSSPSAVRIS